MAHILIADTSEGTSELERILKGHDLVVVKTMSQALFNLRKHPFDLIVVDLHFDDSRMFDLLREVRNCSKNMLKPIICFCSRHTEIARLMHESLEMTTRMLGAWMYLSEHAYNVYQDPDAELRRVMERCLTEEARKEILHQRIDIQKQRAEIQHLRVMLDTQVWSPEMRDYLDGLKHGLEQLLLQVKALQLAAKLQRASVRSSRDLKDRVSEQVAINENSLTDTEEMQSAEETNQAAEENDVLAKEEVRETAGRQKQCKLLDEKQD